MKLFSPEQIRAWDAYTIEQEPIASVDLMNRASTAFADWFSGHYPDVQQPIFVFAGPGNNGGDGLAVARLLFRNFYDVKVFVCALNDTRSPDFQAQLAVLPKDIPVIEGFEWLASVQRDAAMRKRFFSAEHPPIIIDALFGSGLNRALEGSWADLIVFLNGLPCARISIDLPSGLFADQHTVGPCIFADRTLSFQVPKRAFLFPENAERVGDWETTDIGLLPAYQQQTETPFYYLTHTDAAALVHKRGKFSHKGSFGHALIVAGSFGKMGAAVLSARACLRAGAGLVSVKAPLCGHDILQTAVPEAMFQHDNKVEYITTIPDLTPFKSIGIGPGLGQHEETGLAFEQLLESCIVPLLIDADALNLLSLNPELWRKVPKNTILTPHPGEFERLFGKSDNDFMRNDLLRQKAQEHSVFIVLKGANTAIACPDGTCWFNSTGNPGMATGGSGDVLTGIITGLLAQGYAPRDAALLGVYAHGLSGDLAAAARSEAGMIAGDLVEFLPEAWKMLHAD
ncbi:MAG: NAD(P)H-hydrate dehydratase [Bacteroidota bacterium]